ncbi:MAG: pseudouridine synthase [Patescibacteria group bacterium]|nr:pseudouridine synthase [Patescibacteria group bacterium]
MKFVLQKFIVEAGYCSRRKATELIKAGKIAVNGELAELGMKVGESDDVQASGIKLGLKKNKIYIKLNKPIGYICTNRRFKGEKNVFALLPAEAIPSNPAGRRELPLHVAGRLDKNSRGLVLITNDGSLTEKLTHPRYKREKCYRASIANHQLRITNALINNLIFEFKKGIDIGKGDGIVKAQDIKYLGNNKFEIILTEGKKRQIRRMFKGLGFEVADLERTAISRLKLGSLKEGQWRKLNKAEIGILAEAGRE